MELKDPYLLMKYEFLPSCFHRDPVYLRSSLATALSQLISYLNLGGDAEISMPGMGQSLLKGMQTDAGTWCAENSETTMEVEVESLKNYHPDVLSNVGKRVHFLGARGRGWGGGSLLLA